MFHFSSSFMLAVRQRLLSLVGLEPTRSPLQEDLNRLRNDTSKPSSEPWHGLGPRQQTAYISTCGYLDGDSDKSRTPDPGFDCRVDTVNDLWGFCPTTVISASDCGLAAKCIDAFACSSGCGIPKVAGLATLACSDPGAYCSTALLEAGPDQTYSYIVCGRHAATAHLFAAATTPSTTSASSNFSTPTKATPSNSSASSTGISSSTTRKPSPFSTGTSSSTTTKPSPFSTGTLSSTPTKPSPFSTGKSSLTSSRTSGASSSTMSEVSSSTTAASNLSKSSVNNTGVLVGVIVGGLAFIFLVGFAIFFLRLYSRRHPKPSPKQTLWNHDPPKIQSSRNTRLAELSGISRLPHELPGEESVYPSS